LRNTIRFAVKRRPIEWRCAGGDSRITQSISEKCHEIGLLLRVQAQRPDQIVIDVGCIEVAAAIIEGHNFFECLKMTVVKIWTTQANIAQDRGAKLADVVRVAGHLEAPVSSVWGRTPTL